MTGKPLITAQEEHLFEVLDELKPLLPLHWEELALDKDNVPLDPQYHVYLARERNGEVLCVTLREDGGLIGYFVGFVAPGLHYQTCLTMHMDIFYVHPEHRGRKGGLVLFSKVKELALARGVKRWFVGDKVHSAVHAEELFAAFGFELVERVFSLWLGDT